MAYDVWEYNSCNAIADPLSGASAVAMGALGLGKLIPANDASHIAPVWESYLVWCAFGWYCMAIGADNSDKAAYAD